MNKTIRIFLVGAFALLFAAAPVFAQSAIATTTLSAAVTTPDPLLSPFTLGNIIPLTAVTATPLANFNAVSAPAKIYVDHESMDVVAVNTTNKTVTVVRGVDGTIATPHNSGTTVYIATPQYFAQVDLYGACTSTNFAFLPQINVVSGNIRDCLPRGSSSAQWVYNAVVLPGPSDQQISTTNPFGAWETPPLPAGMTFTALTDVATTVWFDQIFIPANATLTGACVMNGSGAGTDSVILFLWDQSGALIANTALAGTVSSGATQLQCIDFTATVSVYGPQTYYVGVQGNGTTAASFQVYPAGSTPKKYGASSKTGVTFGTQPSITPTTTFTAGKGPLMAVY